jgi:hypothetical protein
MRDLNACDRSYQSAFDRMRARVCVCGWAFVLEQTQVSSSASPCLLSNIWRTIDRIVQNYYFFTKIFTQKNIYLQTQTQKGSRLLPPPPNLKCHIALNVTGFTKQGNGSIQV